ncbi:hypothetical protein EDB81DRAFT_347658 [Dactylonectria macrodidyma]|uniref:Uncharacterized protein n=1 Tax=Dactylonectria macrodidyma TaxID=307937 RepID=A0A9P9JCJ2_9HYPO|nr:hypothetical protein EDB81DRAFT_347658 [Dactylonectria macrodidyma]
MPQSYRGGSVFSDGHSDGFSSTSSQWSTTYRKLPKKQKQPLSLRFLSWAAGAPRGATVVKKRTREFPDDRSDMSGWSSGSYFQPDTQLYWVTTPDDRYYYSGSSSSSRSSSGHGSRSGRSSRKGGGSRQKHFNGAVPNPIPPPGPGFGPPMDGNFGPPPPPAPGFGGPFVGGGGFPPPPPPPPPAAAGGAPAFFDVSGQHQPGNPFNGGGPPAGGFHSDGGDYDDEYDSDSTE